MNTLAEKSNLANVLNMSGVLLTNESMASHTSWRTGGTADRYYIPGGVADLSDFVRSLDSDEEIHWLGLGSNLLVRDGGIRGTVIAMTGVLDELEKHENGIRVGAGVTCAKAARFAAASGFTGAEFLAGIPGTMGGALAMNAGAFGGETWQVVHSVEIMDRQGVVHEKNRDEFKVDYRYVNLPGGEWFIAAELHLQAGAEEKSRSNIRELLGKRNDSQPTGVYSCGSVFRNPQGDYAGRIIESCGLKGFSIGGATVSEKHANFIINTGSATSTDIEKLIEHVRQVVLEKNGVVLEPEVRIIGEQV